MTDDQIFEAIGRGCCTEKKAIENGCAVCAPMYEAVAIVRQRFAALEDARERAEDSARVYAAALRASASAESREREAKGKLAALVEALGAANEACMYVPRIGGSERKARDTVAALGRALRAARGEP